MAGINDSGNFHFPSVWIRLLKLSLPPGPLLRQNAGKQPGAVEGLGHYKPHCEAFTRNAVDN